MLVLVFARCWQCDAQPLYINNEDNCMIHFVHGCNRASVNADFDVKMERSHDEITCLVCDMLKPFAVHNTPAFLTCYVCSGAHASSSNGATILVARAYPRHSRPRGQVLRSPSRRMRSTRRQKTR